MFSKYMITLKTMTWAVVYYFLVQFLINDFHKLLFITVVLIIKQAINP